MADRSVHRETLAGDPIAARGLADMTPSERDRYLREYYAPKYRAELRKLADRGLLDEEEDG